MNRVPIPRRGPAVTQQALDMLGQQFRGAFEQGDFMRALKFATQAWEATRSPQPLADVALCHLRLGRSMQAYDIYRGAAEYLKTANVYDGLAEAAGQLGKWGDVREYGTMSLQLKLLEAERETPAATADSPVLLRFDERNRARNVIAFSLFGSDPRYCEMALLNVRAAHEFFPAWVCRFYVDGSVPAAVCERLAAAGASVIDAHSVGGQDLPGKIGRAHV